MTGLEALKIVEKDCEDLEQVPYGEFAIIEKSLKALEIIKEKNVDVDYFLFWSKQGNLGKVEDYNILLKHKNGRYQRLLLTEEEFNTLKDVLI